MTSAFARFASLPLLATLGFAAGCTSLTEPDEISVRAEPAEERAAAPQAQAPAPQAAQLAAQKPAAANPQGAAAEGAQPPQRKVVEVPKSRGGGSCGD